MVGEIDPPMGIRHLWVNQEVSSYDKGYRQALEDIGKMGAWATHSYRKGSGYSTVWEKLEVVALNLREFADLCRKHGVTGWWDDYV